MNSTLSIYYLLTKKLFNLRKIIINEFIISLQHLVLWGFKCSSQRFRGKKNKRNIFGTQKSLFYKIYFASAILFHLISIHNNSNIIGSKGKRCLIICRYILIWKIQYFRVACLILCCGPLFAIVCWNHSENI